MLVTASFVYLLKVGSLPSLLCVQAAILKIACFPGSCGQREDKEWTSSWILHFWCLSLFGIAPKSNQKELGRPMAPPGRGKTAHQGGNAAFWKAKPAA